jgi:hypothetical protein
MRFSDLSPPEIGVLVDLLADTDVLFTPVRTIDPIAPVFQRRQLYATAGVPCLAAGLDTDRKSAERRFAQLEDDGFLTVSMVGWRRHCRLTDAADWCVRSLVGQFSIDCSFPAMAVIDSMASAGYGCGHFVLETTILGVDYGQPGVGETLVLLELLLLPALHRGLIESEVDSGQHVAYSLTDDGRRALASSPPVAPPDLPAFDQVFSDRYDERFRTRLRRREHWCSTIRGDLSIPMASGCWPVLPPSAKLLALQIP